MERLTMIAEKLPGQKKMDQHLDMVRHYIQLFTAHESLGAEVRSVIDDAVSSQGKMLRPQLLLLSGKFGPRYQEVQDRLYRLAAIIELTHLSSLIHDDIIDDAPTRRGKQSVQGKYGKDAAVYAGDFLLSRISYQISASGFSRAGVILSEAVEEMCLGEINQAISRYKENVSVEAYLRNIHGKTAALFMAACKIGAEESGCDREMIVTMEKFAEALGIMFQLRDDLLDFTSSEAEMGKSTHKDFQDGIYTMPVLCAMQHPQGREKLLTLMRANAEGTLSEQQIRQMESLVIELNGVSETREVIRQYQKQAEIYAGKLPQCKTADLMRRLLHRLEF